MAVMRVFVVFVLPAIFSIVLGAAVLNSIVQQPDRELNMWPFGSAGSHSSASIGLLGLSDEYSTSEPVELQLQVNNFHFSCGDIYVTIYDAQNDTAVTQSGFFDQCFNAQNPVHPVDFSEVIDTPGSYALVVEIISKELDVVSQRGLFTVK